MGKPSIALPGKNGRHQHFFSETARSKSPGFVVLWKDMSAFGFIVFNQSSFLDLYFECNLSADRTFRRKRAGGTRSSWLDSVDPSSITEEHVLLMYGLKNKPCPLGKCRSVLELCRVRQNEIYPKSLIASPFLFTARTAAVTLSAWMDSERPSGWRHRHQFCLRRKLIKRWPRLLTNAR